MTELDLECFNTTRVQALKVIISLVRLLVELNFESTKNNFGKLRYRLREYFQNFAFCLHFEIFRETFRNSEKL